MLKFFKLLFFNIWVGSFPEILDMLCYIPEDGFCVHRILLLSLIQMAFCVESGLSSL